ncbi:hypothetical protein NE237_014369 [Protea cynaroides]|uniref:RING-type E3 ubiquitin transferase n=1 Tax=Protea cynaroides TaxID=273540 RepID=A0A9Q0KBU3_9MAGN|nr:hypothetical protein NE237_014369 [Protea cynaroides]
MSSTKNEGAGGDPRSYSNSPSSSYALSGKIMLSAVIILFAVVIVIICLHIYARWFLIRERSRQLSRRRRRRQRTHIIFSFEPSGTSADSVFVPSRGLDESVLKSLPTFVYSSAAHGGGAGGVLECAVCLSEFEDDEKGRLLPKCNHSFHIECIDMWFHSHSTCPLCRTPVGLEIPAAAAAASAAALPNESPVEVAVKVDEPEAGPSYGMCPSCRHDKDETGCSSSSSSFLPSSSSAASSSLGTRRKTLEGITVSIEVPRRNDTLRSLEEEQLCLGSSGFQRWKSPRGQQGLKSPRFQQGLKSPREQQGLRSPGGRILSLKRMLSREMKGSLSPSTAGLSYSPVANIDLESGGEKRIQDQPKS